MSVPPRGCDANGSAGIPDPAAVLTDLNKVGAELDDDIVIADALTVEEETAAVMNSVSSTVTTCDTAHTTRELTTLEVVTKLWSLGGLD